MFATKAPRHEEFYFSVLVPWWREEKSFAAKNTKKMLSD
jgi:hypothetical protein